MQRPVANILDGDSGLILINGLFLGFMVEIVSRATAMSSMAVKGRGIASSSKTPIQANRLSHRGRRILPCNRAARNWRVTRPTTMAAKFPCHLLADSPEGIRKEAELTGKLPGSADVPPACSTVQEKSRRDAGAPRFPYLCTVRAAAGSD
jgi:hypothetical protein